MREFLITKSKEVNGMNMDEIIQIIKETANDTEEALVAAMKEADKDTGTIQAAVAVSRTLSAFRDSLSEEDLTEIAKSLKFEPEDDSDDATDDDDVTKDDGDDDAEGVDKSDDSDSDDSDSDDDDVTKSDDDTEIKELQNRIVELETSKREQELAEMVSGLRVGKTEEELIAVLKAVDSPDSTEALDSVLGALRAADESIRVGLGEIGSEMPGIVSQDAYGQLETLAREVQKSSDAPMGFEKAMEIASEQNPDLMKKYYEEV